MGTPIDRTAKTALDSNLVNGVTSDAPKVKANNDALYNYADTLNSALDTHAAASTLPHADGSVTGPKIKDGAITEPKYATGSVSSRAIANGAVGVNQLATGLGATADVQAQFAKRGIDVTSAPYNAIGDGVTDDTVAIRAAFTAVSNGGTVYFPPGTYIVNLSAAIVVPSNVTILGSSATIKYKNGMTNKTLFDLSGKNNVRIENITFDGNSSAVSDVLARKDRDRVVSGSGCTYITIEKCTFRNTIGGAVRLSSSEDVTITSNVFDNTGYGAIYIVNNFKNIRVRNNKLSNIFQMPIRVSTTKAVAPVGWTNENVFITGNIIKNAYTDNHDIATKGDEWALGIECHIELGKKIDVSHNIIYGAEDMGISISCNNEAVTDEGFLYNAIVSNNIIENVDQYGLGIEIVKCVDVLVSDNTVINAASMGMNCDKSTHIRYSRNCIKSPTATDANRSGFFINASMDGTERSSYVYFDDNEVYGFSFGVLANRASDHIFIRRNTFDRQFSMCIMIRDGGADSSEISNNTFRSKRPLEIQGGIQISFHDNFVDGSGVDSFILCTINSTIIGKLSVSRNHADSLNKILSVGGSPNISSFNNIIINDNILITNNSATIQSCVDSKANVFAHAGSFFYNNLVFRNRLSHMSPDFNFWKTSIDNAGTVTYSKPT